MQDGFYKWVTGNQTMIVQHRKEEYFVIESQQQPNFGNERELTLAELRFMDKISLLHSALLELLKRAEYLQECADVIGANMSRLHTNFKKILWALARGEARGNCAEEHPGASMGE